MIHHKPPGLISSRLTLRHPNHPSIVFRRRVRMFTRVLAGEALDKHSHRPPEMNRHGWTVKSTTSSLERIPCI